MKKTVIYSHEPAKGWLPWGLLAPFLSILFVVAPLLCMSFVLEYFHLLDAKGDPVNLIGLFAFLLFPFALIGLVVLVWVHFVERRSIETIGLISTNRAKTFLSGHAVGLSTSFAVVAAIWLAGGFVANGYGKAFDSRTTLMNMGFLMLCFAVQSSVEEIIFRGWLFSAITRRLNIVLGIAITSLVFAFLHFSPQQHWIATLSLLLFSVFACCWALKAGNIWGVMGWHAGWNWMLSVGFELPVTGLDVKMPALIVKLTAIGPAFLTGGRQGPEGSFICVIFFAGASAFLAWRAETDRKSLRQADEARRLA